MIRLPQQRLDSLRCRDGCETKRTATALLQREVVLVEATSRRCPEDLLVLRVRSDRFVDGYGRIRIRRVPHHLQPGLRIGVRILPILPLELNRVDVTVKLESPDPSGCM